MLPYHGLDSTPLYRPFSSASPVNGAGFSADSGLAVYADVAKARILSDGELT